MPPYLLMLHAAAEIDAPRDIVYEREHLGCDVGVFVTGTCLLTVMFL